MGGRRKPAATVNTMGIWTRGRIRPRKGLTLFLGKVRSRGRQWQTRFPKRYRIWTGNGPFFGRKVTTLDLSGHLSEILIIQAALDADSSRTLKVATFKELHFP